MANCTHCGVGVVSTPGGDWSHVTHLSRCQSPDVPYSHLAHPSDVPCRAQSPNPCLGAQEPGGCTHHVGQERGSARVDD